MLYLIAQSCLILCDLMDCSLPGSSVCGDSPGKNTGVGFHALLQGIFPTQGLNPGLHCWRILYHLSHQGMGFMFDWFSDSKKCHQRGRFFPSLYSVGLGSHSYDYLTSATFLKSYLPNSHIKDDHINI